MPQNPATCQETSNAPKPSRVILNERGLERFRGPEVRQLFGAGSGVGSEESAFQNFVIDEETAYQTAYQAKKVKPPDGQSAPNLLNPFRKFPPPHLQVISPLGRILT